ncbi:hypothetical protein ACSBR2_009979 [Camellia fascicularis]
MAFGRRILSSIFDNKNDSNQEKNFLENGSMFLEDLIAFSNAGGSIELLSKCLYESKCSSSLTWKSRLKITNDIAYAIIYMHTVFSAPIIYRDLEPNNIIINQSSVAELLDFSVSISIPPGETQVEDKVVGTVGFIDPEYMSTGFLTEKSDVYSFGVILLELLTGKKP